MRAATRPTHGLRAPCVAAALLLLCAGCAQDLASPFSAVVVAWDPDVQSYKLAQVRVSTLTSLRRLTGTAGTLRAGGSVRVRAAALRAPGATVDSLRARSIATAPSEVDLSYNVANDLVYPEGYLSLELLTAYANVERARTSFAGWGLTTLAPALLVAHADVQDDARLNPLGDGELFYMPLGNWYLPAPADTQQLPLHFNLGAVGHALAHQAIAQIVWGGAALPPVEQGGAADTATLTARHLARSMAEGMSDYLGVAVSRDARWFDHSVQQTAATRALDPDSLPRCGTANMLDALSVDDAQVPYNAFPLGTAIAGALREAEIAVGGEPAAKGVLAALPVLRRAAANGNGRLALADVLDALASSAAPSRLPALCGIALDRFKSLGVTSLPSCSGVKVAPPAVTCP